MWMDALFAKGSTSTLVAYALWRCSTIYGGYECNHPRCNLNCANEIKHVYCWLCEIIVAHECRVTGTTC